jgi:hypothetical protein
MEDQMNRTKLLVTTAIAAFVAASGVSMAQQERIPPQERSAPTEKIAPPGSKQPSATQQHQNEGPGAPASRNERQNGRVGEGPQSRGRSETTGQAPREEQNRSGGRNSAQERGKAEQGQKSERNEQNRTSGQAPREDRLNRGPEQNRATGQAPREDRTNRSSEQNRLNQERGRTEENRTTTGQGAAGTRPNVTVNLTPEKRTRIHEVIVQERSAPRISNPNFSVSIGAQVPRTVRFVALPRTILEIEPEWRGFEYFMVGDRMVIIDPRTMEIVAVVDV